MPFCKLIPHLNSRTSYDGVIGPVLQEAHADVAPYVAVIAKAEEVLRVLALHALLHHLIKLLFVDQFGRLVVGCEFVHAPLSAVLGVTLERKNSLILRDSDFDFSPLTGPKHCVFLRHVNHVISVDYNQA